MGWGGAKAYDNEKAWSSVNHSVLSTTDSLEITRSSVDCGFLLVFPDFTDLLLFCFLSCCKLFLGFCSCCGLAGLVDESLQVYKAQQTNFKFKAAAQLNQTRVYGTPYTVHQAVVVHCTAWTKELKRHQILKCRIYRCFIEFIDWRYSQSCQYPRPLL